MIALLRRDLVQVLTEIDNMRSAVLAHS